MNKITRRLILPFIIGSTVFLTACGGGGGGDSTSDPIPVSIGVTITSDTTTFSENAGSGSFSVVLNVEPDNDVVIDLVSQDETEATIDKSQITFTTSNWNVPQIILLSGINDDSADGNQTFFINLSINLLTTDTSGYAELLPEQISNAHVTVMDDDSPGVTVSALQNDISENSGSDTFDIVLNTQPDGTVVINLINDNSTAALLDITQVTFDSSSWNTPQTITITGIDDSLTSGNKTAIINFDIDVASTDATGYYSISVLPEVTATILDNEVPITLFNAGTFNGNLGGRAGADAKCIAAASQIQACANKTNVHAFLSSSTTDQLKDIPIHYGYSSAMPIQGPTGAVISTNWSELFTWSTFSGPLIQQSLASSGVLPANQKWWSGSRYEGTTSDYAGNHCNDWTTSGSTTHDKSWIGNSSNVDLRWIYDGVWNSPSSFAPNQSFYCSNTIYLVCSCGV